MEDLARYIIDETIEELQEGSGDFVIDNDEKAEWAIKKIAQERAEAERIKDVCEDVIQRYQERIAKSNADADKKTAYLEYQLRRYMDTVNAKETKTQKSYKLPSGTLKVKYQGPEFKRDNDKLADFLVGRYDEYLEIKVSPKWGELKKIVEVQGDKAILADTGEVIEGVEVIEREPVFEVVV